MLWCIFFDLNKKYKVEKYYYIQMMSCFVLCPWFCSVNSYFLQFSHAYKWIFCLPTTQFKLGWIQLYIFPRIKMLHGFNSNTAYRHNLTVSKWKVSYPNSPEIYGYYLAFFRPLSFSLVLGSFRPPRSCKRKCTEQFL